MPIPPNLRDQVTLLLLNGTSVDAAEAFCFRNGLDPEAAKGIVAEARKRITVAADYSRDEQIAIAVSRLNDIYGKAVVGTDYRTALAAQKELSRLLALYSQGQRDGTGGPDEEDISTIRQQVELIEAYLRPLNLVPEQYPIEEHARVAAEAIRSSGLAKV